MSATLSNLAFRRCLNLAVGLTENEAALAPTHEEITANAAGRVRSETVNGREFLVAPMTLIVPGVLHGSKGPLYYPPEEIAQNVQAWNGMPLVVLHPTRNGAPVSGRDPRVMAENEIGRVYNAQIGPGGKLVAEGWFDVEATHRADHTKSIIPRLRKNEPVELSTGLFTQNEPRRGVYNSRPYTHVARNYRPDHLAILPDRRGACGVNDGCGVLVNELTTNEYTDKRSSTVPTAGLSAFVVNAMKPSAALKKDGMTPEKACKIMSDGSVNGHKLSKAQKGMFGSLCGQREEPAKNEDRPAPSVGELMGRVIANAFCATGKGGGIKTDCSPKNAGGGGAKVGGAFGGSGGGAKGSKGHSTWSGPSKFGAKKSSDAKSSPAAKPAAKSAPAPAPKKTVLKVSASTLKAAKKLESARQAAKKSGNKEAEAKATAKLKRIVDKAKETQGKSQKGKVGDKIEARKAEKGRTTESKGVKDRGAGKVTEAKVRATAKIAKIAEKAAKSGDAAKVSKAKAKLAKIVEKANPNAKSKETTGGRERKAGQVTKEKVKALEKHTKAYEAAVKSGDKAKAAKAASKIKRIHSKVVRNERQYTRNPLVLNEEVLEHNGQPSLLKQAANLALFIINYAAAEAGVTINDEDDEPAEQPNEQPNEQPTTNCEGMKKCNACAAKDAAMNAAKHEPNTPEMMMGRMMEKVPDEETHNKAMKPGNTKKRCKMKKDGTMECPDGVNTAEPHALMDKTVIAGPTGNDGGADETATQANNDDDGCESRCKQACAAQAKAQKGQAAAPAPGKQSYFDTCPRDANGHCKKSGLPSEESGSAGGKYIAVKNANPNQPRGERGKWATAKGAEVFKIHDVVRKMFGGKDPGPIQAMPAKADQGEPQSDPDQDAEAAEAHSPAAAMAANVTNMMSVIGKYTKKHKVTATKGSY